ncbi:DUF2237 domain-containing protein [Endozoicomonas sp. OPT23]|uniref:DUF2237 family protein n=1 Tax=Endozoicomonas sp. OPT23 TaxID=2072845 RepID=UPI00129A73FE|nr:DUF2237 domain-containing protein [Endozoicomonas sp. OPT23]MRI34462.1 DUF2237 domain-containing protein [Endozoicomonas sp. OPT23]
MPDTKPPQLNVLGLPIEPCCLDPVTGFFRDGYCHTSPMDTGIHTICVQTTKEFLQYSISRGNDLSTPKEEFGFPGLKPGDRWCLCAHRWLEAYRDNQAPAVFILSTHIKSLEVIPLDILKSKALDLS